MLLPNSPVASTANAENPIPHSHVEVRGSGKTKNGNSISFKTVISLFFLAFSHHPNKPTTEYRLEKKKKKQKNKPCSSRFRRNCLRAHGFSGNLTNNPNPKKNKIRVRVLAELLLSSLDR